MKLLPEFHNTFYKQLGKETLNIITIKMDEQVAEKLYSKNSFQSPVKLGGYIR